MPTLLQVEDQLFTFGDAWTSVFKYGDTDFYRSKVEKHLPQTKAVDVLGVRPKQGLLLLEAKDFRGYRIANKKRLGNGELAIEVAAKVKDTVAGVLGGFRGREKGFESVGKHVVSTEKLIVVLWLEDDTSQNLFEWKTRLDTINQKIKECLAWLGPIRTYVLSSQTYNKQVPDLTVANLKKS
jgi:hypothetical protein